MAFYYEFGIHQWIVYSVTFIYLLIASISDLRTREVYDWLNYGAVASGLGINLIFTLANFDYMFAFKSLLGFGVFFVIAYALFYTGQWGGGDSKSIMALGALLGPFTLNGIPFLFPFVINIAIAGGIYGLVWSVVLAFLNWGKIHQEIKKKFSSKKFFIARVAIIILAFISIIIQFTEIGSLLKLAVFGVFIALTLTSYISVFISSVEKECMHKKISPSQLTEGDWITKDIYVNRKYVCGPKDLGISKKQIALLKKYHSEGKIKDIPMKIGIPFIPSFLLAFLATIIYGNLLLKLF